MAPKKKGVVACVDSNAGTDSTDADDSADDSAGAEGEEEEEEDSDGEEDETDEPEAAVPDEWILSNGYSKGHILPNLADPAVSDKKKNIQSKLVVPITTNLKDMVKHYHDKSSRTLPQDRTTNVGPGFRPEVALVIDLEAEMKLNRRSITLTKKGKKMIVDLTGYAETPVDRDRRLMDGPPITNRNHLKVKKTILKLKNVWKAKIPTFPVLKQDYMQDKPQLDFKTLTRCIRGAGPRRLREIKQAFDTTHDPKRRRLEMCSPLHIMCHVGRRRMLMYGRMVVDKNNVQNRRMNYNKNPAAVLRREAASADDAVARALKASTVAKAALAKALGNGKGKGKHSRCEPDTDFEEDPPAAQGQGEDEDEDEDLDVDPEPDDENLETLSDEDEGLNPLALDLDGESDGESDEAENSMSGSMSGSVSDKDEVGLSDGVSDGEARDGSDRESDEDEDGEPVPAAAPKTKPVAAVAPKTKPVPAAAPKKKPVPAQKAQKAPKAPPKVKPKAASNPPELVAGRQLRVLTSHWEEWEPTMDEARVPFYLGVLMKQVDKGWTVAYYPTQVRGKGFVFSPVLDLTPFIDKAEGKAVVLGFDKCMEFLADSKQDRSQKQYFDFIASIANF